MPPQTNRIRRNERGQSKNNRTWRTRGGFWRRSKSCRGPANVIATADALKLSAQLLPPPTQPRPLQLPPPLLLAREDPTTTTWTTTRKAVAAVTTTKRRRTRMKRIVQVVAVPMPLLRNELEGIQRRRPCQWKCPLSFPTEWLGRQHHNLSTAKLSSA